VHLHAHVHVHAHRYQQMGHSSSKAPGNVADKTIFDFEVPSATEDEAPLSLSSLKGKKAYLVVNVASQ